MSRPDTGLCVPVRIERILDGDTIEVAVKDSSYRWKIRVIDCWAPELSTPEGRAAQEAAIKLAGSAKTVHVHLPLPKRPSNLLGSLITFDRLLGHVWLDDTRSFATEMVAAGHATREKP